MTAVEIPPFPVELGRGVLWFLGVCCCCCVPAKEVCFEAVRGLGVDFLGHGDAGTPAVISAGRDFEGRLVLPHLSLAQVAPPGRPDCSEPPHREIQHPRKNTQLWGKGGSCSSLQLFAWTWESEGLGALAVNPAQHSKLLISPKISTLPGQDL